MDSAAVRRANLVGNLQRRGMSSISGVSLSAYSSGSVLWQADLFCYFFSSANPVLSGMQELASVWNRPSDLFSTAHLEMKEPALKRVDLPEQLSLSFILVEFIKGISVLYG